MEHNCCVTYTIRCDVKEFIIRKSHKKILRRIVRYLEALSNNSNSNNNNGSGAVVEKKHGKYNQPLSLSGLMTNIMNNQLFNIETLPISNESSYDYQQNYMDVYILYEKYQKHIHKEQDTTFNDMKRFLLTSNLVFQPITSPHLQSTNNDTLYYKMVTKYGSYIQKYYIANELVAVGFIDILPETVSSVYFVYDPKYEFLSMGTFSALAEIYFASNLAKLNIIPTMKYYYMGYYIENCVKMRYKKQFFPLSILCPISYSWCNFEEISKNYNLSIFNNFSFNTTPSTATIDSNQSINDFSNPTINQIYNLLGIEIIQQCEVFITK